MADTSGDFLEVAQRYKGKWDSESNDYWFKRIAQEIGELAGVLSGDHDDTLEHELKQIISIGINWLAKLEKDSATTESEATDG